MLDSGLRPSAEPTDGEIDTVGDDRDYLGPVGNYEA
jgi:hypothetical protein